MSQAAEHLALMPTIEGFVHEDNSWRQPQDSRCAVVPLTMRVSVTVEQIAQSVIEPA